MTNWFEDYQKLKLKQAEEEAGQDQKGGPGSGHHGHAGRPGQRGGSAPGKGGGVSASEQANSRWRPIGSRDKLPAGTVVGIQVSGGMLQGTLVSINRSRIRGVPSTATVKVSGHDQTHSIMSVHERVLSMSLARINERLQGRSSGSSAAQLDRFFRRHNVPVVGRSRLTTADVYALGDGFGEFAISFDKLGRRRFRLDKIDIDDIEFD